MVVRPGDPCLGWSAFALERHEDPTSGAVFRGTPEALLELVAQAWPDRQPGFGRTDLRKVVVVPVPPDRFVASTVRVTEETPLVADVHRRQEHEEPVIRVCADGEPEPARFARVVLYSKEALVENDGTRTTEADWEVVALIASAVADEPMHPTTMARNFLEKAGGTYAPYTAEQFAEAVWYWAQRAKRYVPED